MTGFDSIAPFYDTLWTQTSVGDLQRQAVWKLIDPLFQPGAVVLDAGCGTGADAVHLRQAGIHVHGIDSSAEMVRITRAKGIDAHVHSIEQLCDLGGCFDGAISNFGALNCVKSIQPIAGELGRLIRPGGFVALCFLGRICLWEIGYYLLRGDFTKALRRLSGRAQSSYRIEVFYHSRRAILKAFQDKFILCRQSGIGVTVPPSYVRSFSQPVLAMLAALDSKLASWPVFRSIADHQLYIWRRI